MIEELYCCTLSSSLGVNEKMGRYRKIDSRMIDNALDDFDPDSNDVKAIVESGNDSIEVDFHSYTLSEVKTWFHEQFVGYALQGFEKFTCVHGFRRGKTIRTYVRQQVKTDLEKLLPHFLITVGPVGPGTTSILVRPR